MPELAHHADLQRLSHVLHATRATHLVILGDFLHSRLGADAATKAALQAWRNAWPRVHITLIPGNHDRGAGLPGEWLALECHEEPYSIGPFAACHYPQTMPDAIVLAGHLHPGVRMESCSAPCFHLTPGCLTLPAFGSFTGFGIVRPGAAARIFIVDGEEIVELP